MKLNLQRTQWKAAGAQSRASIITIIKLILPAVVFCGAQVSAGEILSPFSSIRYNANEPIFKMNMGDTKEVTATLLFDKDYMATKSYNLLGINELHLNFEIKTISPQFNIVSFNKGVNEKNNTQSDFTVTLKQVKASDYSYDLKFNLSATYIGHATLKLISLKYINSSAAITRDYSQTITRNFRLPSGNNLLPVMIVPKEGIWQIIFIVSVTLFIIISYINLGAQLDVENISQMIKRPKTIVLGFFISVLVMPLASWYTSQWLLADQALYRVGSFIFACGPAASASTLWTVMLEADKELSVGLQVASTVGALMTMPLLLYIMDLGMHLEGSQFRVKVPYVRLSQTLFVLLVALFIGWRFVGTNVKAKKISQKIFRPLTFFVLLFIIIFSSIIYHYIYQMFDWKITLASFIITSVTYIVSGLLGQLINCNKDHSIAISVGSTYKNSGIAFAVLVVAFEAPDTYIAYVPCLTQVVTTSLALYLFYVSLNCLKCINTHYSSVPTETQTVSGEGGADRTPKKDARSNSAGEQSTRSDENDEFIAMDVTDIVVDSSQETSVKNSEKLEKAKD